MGCNAELYGSELVGRCAGGGNFVRGEDVDAGVDRFLDVALALAEVVAIGMETIREVEREEEERVERSRGPRPVERVVEPTPVRARSEIPVRARSEWEQACEDLRRVDVWDWVALVVVVMVVGCVGYMGYVCVGVIVNSMGPVEKSLAHTLTLTLPNHLALPLSLSSSDHTQTVGDMQVHSAATGAVGGPAGVGREGASGVECMVDMAGCHGHVIDPTTSPDPNSGHVEVVHGSHVHGMLLACVGGVRCVMHEVSQEGEVSHVMHGVLHARGVSHVVHMCVSHAWVVRHVMHGA